MASEFVSRKQKELFLKIATSGELVFACGPSGISANIVGEFHIRHYSEKKEDRLEVGDGTQHVHINWDRVKSVESSLFHGEGVLTFKDGDEKLFILYRMAGDFSDKVKSLAGSLV